jgi:hypothetical protein
MNQLLWSTFSSLNSATKYWQKNPWKKIVPDGAVIFMPTTDLLSCECENWNLAEIIGI